MSNQFYSQTFRPVKDLSGTVKTNRYYISASDTNDYAVGTPVTLAGGACSNDLVNGAVGNLGIRTITKATGGDGYKLLGFIVGFADMVPLNFDSAVNYNPAYQERIAIVSDAPEQEYEGVCNTALTATDASKNANVTIGSINTTTKIDASSINASTNTTNTFQLKLLGLAPIPSNAFGANQTLRFKINNHCLANIVAGI